MESEVQEAQEVPRSELDAAFDILGSERWMVVPFMSSSPWGYVVWFGDREEWSGIRVAFDLVVP